jgi:NACalpha-BTF3-like transcription factor
MQVPGQFAQLTFRSHFGSSRSPKSVQQPPSSLMFCQRTIHGKAVNRKRIDREPLGTPVGEQLEASDESGASPKDIELVMTFATSSRSTAVADLEANNFGRPQEDIVNAIMHIMTAALTSPKDIGLVMTLAECSRSTAVAALEANNFGRTQEDIVNAIMHIMTA